MCAPLTLYGVPQEKGVEILNQTGYQSLHIFGTKATFAAWQELPLAYVYCLNDGINPYPFQKQQIETLQKDTRREITVFKCDAAHFANVTDSDRLVRIIRTVVGELEDDN